MRGIAPGSPEPHICSKSKSPQLGNYVFEYVIMYTLHKCSFKLKLKTLILYANYELVEEEQLQTVEHRKKSTLDQIKNIFNTRKNKTYKQKKI